MPFLSIWRPKDSSESGPKVDEIDATVTVEDGGDFAVVLHVASDYRQGLWTVAVTLSDDEAIRLAHELLASIGEDEITREGRALAATGTI